MEPSESDVLSHRFASLLRRHDWVFNLIFIGVGACFIAGAANAVAGYWLRVVPEVNDAAIAAPARAVRPAGHPTLVRAAVRNLLGLKREDVAPQADQPTAVPQVSGRDFKESELHPCTVGAVLRATLVADGAPEWSLAVMLNNATRETQVYSINEGQNKIAEDAILVAVRSREVVVRRRDHFERCLGEGEGAAAPPMIPAPAPVASAGDDPASLVPGDMTGVTKFSETDYKVERTELDKTLANLNEVATQARIVPSFRNGAPNGFKLFSIRPGSIYAKIGLQNGDVIQKINGFEMNSPDRALEVYTKLRDATNLTIELQRRGATMTMNYKIQ